MELRAAIEALSALAQDTRLAAFRLLVAEGPGGVAAGEVARRLAVPANTMSTHLAVLARAGLVASRREGRAVIYAADMDGIRALLGFLLRDCCGGHPEICAPLLDVVGPGAACHPPSPSTHVKSVQTPAMTSSHDIPEITIWHNPACGTSRNTLGLIRNSGVEPRIVEYLRTPPSRAEIRDAAERAGTGVRGLLREKGTPFHELGLGDPALTEDDLLDAMVAHPILINRPVVFTPRGVRLCRPSEVVLDILPNPQRGAFVKEDGEVVVAPDGRRTAPRA